jgi:D-beta-D-heptose 7-phosphate kinase / D-beta-D-heptose 1-phosphate adenosyltransferase
MRFPAFDPRQPPRILVVGDLMLDRYLWGTCDRVSPEAPVQVVNVQRESYALGGAGNVLANLRSLGAHVELVALVGRDFAQTPLARLLAEHGVAHDALVHDVARPTTVKTRVLAAHHQLLRFDVESCVACSDEHAAAVIARVQERLGHSQVVILSDYGKGLLRPSVVRNLIEQCQRAGTPILIDPKGRDYAVYRGASLLTPNRREAAAAIGFALDSQADVTRAGRQLLHEHALGSCLITLSEDGMALFEADQEHRLPTQAREVFDVTGAGDTVIAAIAFGLATGLPMLEACRFANSAAGVVVGKLGSATVTLAELASAKRSASTLEPAAKIRESVETLLPELTRLRAEGRTVVFTNGCFDILHAGHVQYLTQAAALGDVLVVGLNSDASVRRLKGAERPINTQADRALLLAALSAVSYVVPFAEDTPLALISQIEPHVLVKGGDYRAEDIVGGDVVRRAGGSVRVLPFVPGKSTTAMLERAMEAKA